MDFLGLQVPDSLPSCGSSTSRGLDDERHGVQFVHQSKLSTWVLFVTRVHKYSTIE